jgi:hypothetical protein
MDQRRNPRRSDKIVSGSTDLIPVWGSDEDDGEGQWSRMKTWGRKTRGETRTI